MAKLKRYIRMNSIKLAIILYFMGLIAIMVLFLSLSSYRNTIRDTENVSISYTERLLREVNGAIDSYIDNIKSMGAVVVENSDVRSLMAFYNRHQDKILGYLEQQELDTLKERASAHMNIVAKTRSDITNIAIISKYGDVVLSDAEKQVNPNSEYNLSDWYLKPMSYRDDTFVSPSHVQNLVLDEYKWVISISKAIIDPDSGLAVGVMLIDLNYRSIESICENVQLGKTGYIYLTDENNNLIYHPQQQLVNSGIKLEDTARLFPRGAQPDGTVRDEATGKIYIRSHSPTTGWYALGVVNTQDLIVDRAYIVQFYLVLALVSIVFAGLFAVMISGGITRPLKKLENTMHRVEEGELGVAAEIERDDEIGHLGKTFNTMVERIRVLMENQVSKEEEKRKSELKALQAQINPHFLYNTLETIIWMSASGKNEEVVQVTSALAQLFRTSLSQGESLVELHVEIGNIESYLTIQKMRYKDKLNYTVEIGDEYRGLMIPKLILQPIVENAIYHGLKPKPEGGTIVIGCRKSGDGVAITVRDDGVGMTKEQIEALFEPGQSSERGIGVLNVHNRIQLVFGESYGLRYHRLPAGGTLVEIRLPAVGEGGRIDA